MSNHEETIDSPFIAFISPLGHGLHNLVESNDARSLGQMATGLVENQTSIANRFSQLLGEDVRNL